MDQFWLRVLFVVIISEFSIENELGKSCRTYSGKTGVCKFFDYCDIHLLLAEQDVVNCESDNGDPTICCPSNTPTPATATQKCQEYRNKKPLGTTGTVFGGDDVKNIDEFPHMALLGFGTGDNVQWLCGGTLISEKFVLTAAHCLQSKDNPVTRVQFGLLDKRNKNEYGTLQEFRVINTYTHPDRSPRSRYNDIALLELDRSVDFTYAVYPACLQTEYDVKKPYATVLGWGLLESGQAANILQKVRLNLTKYEDCSETYPKSLKLRQGIDYTTQICAGDDKKDACQGDSGGPMLIYDDTGMPKIIGITSFGFHCGIVPGVYTRVSHYVPWIENIIWS